jgi:outer membrane protein assembly factor BamE (lipoprotein component of BamABCDE complex)
MRHQLFVSCLGLALCVLGASASQAEDGWSRSVPPPHVADTIGAATLAQLKPGTSTKSEVKALLGEPWRILQFNDCGMSMAGQADETWDYRGKNANGSYRVHIEFDDNDVASLVAKIPDHATGTKGTRARIAPGGEMKMAMKM